MTIAAQDPIENDPVVSLTVNIGAMSDLEGGLRPEAGRLRAPASDLHALRGEIHAFHRSGAHLEKRRADRSGPAADLEHRWTQEWRIAKPIKEARRNINHRRKAVRIIPLAPFAVEPTRDARV